jgi:hypothetical protein
LTAKVAGQLFVWLNAPLTAMFETVTGRPPVFDKFAVCAALVVPTNRVANVKVVGDNVTVGGATPVPLKATLCGLAVPV